MNIWEKYGFRINPYETSPIGADDEGAELLVGRNNEVRQLRMLLASSTMHPTIEGPNGVGKTSVVAVASYLSQQEFVNSQSQTPLLPLGRPLQLSSDASTSAFTRRVFLEAAQAMIQHHALLSKLDRPVPVPGIDEIQKWLNVPIMTGGGSGGSIAGFGLNSSSSESANTSSGFSESGFQLTVRRWLDALFPYPGAGGFIGVIDNLEILETSRKARELLEALRDEIFNVQGLRWVLCGARGIVRSVASSSRLQGILSDPIDLQPIQDKDVPDVIARRERVYGTPGNSYLPVEPQGFRHLYDVANKNLRTALKFAHDYSTWLEMNGTLPESAADKLALLEVWMAQKAEEYEDATKGVGERAWKVFDEITDRGRGVSPSEFESFGFKRPQAMRPQVKALEDARLVDSSIDETDQRRRTIEISARGWIVRYKRRGFKLPT